MENNDASMRVNFSVQRITQLTDRVRRDVSFRNSEDVVMTGDRRLSYVKKKTLVSQRDLSTALDDREVLQRAFEESRSSLYKRLVAWFDELPCNCGDETDG